MKFLYIPIILSLSAVTNLFGQAKIDSIISVTFPDEYEILRTEKSGSKIIQYYLRTPEESFILQRAAGMGMKSFGDGPNNEVELLEFYEGVANGQRGSMKKMDLEVIESRHINIKGLMGYKIISNHRSTGEKAWETIVFLIGTNLYSLIYTSNEFDENSKDIFFNSLEVNMAENMPQITGTRSSNNIHESGKILGNWIGSMIFFIGAIIGVILLIRKIRK